MQHTVRLAISTEQEVDELVIHSIQNPSLICAIFKHSTRCNISSMVLQRLDNAAFFEEHNILFYYLDLIQHRNVSLYIAQKFNIEHESPQLLIIKEGLCIAHANHTEVKASWLAHIIQQMS